MTADRSGLKLASTTDPGALRRAFGCFPSGVAAVCADIGGVLTGMAISSFTSVSLDPPLVSICADRSSATWPVLRSAPRLGVSILGDTHDEVCRRLASRTGDRFSGVSLERSASGAVLLHGAAAWLEAAVATEVPAGDHVVVLLRVVALAADPEVPPLLFHTSTFRQVGPVTEGSSRIRRHQVTVT
jgi:flavin reductase (DIM6/NTAB) family NADH-FMN oxidoreductase RutF